MKRYKIGIEGGTVIAQGSRTSVAVCRGLDMLAAKGQGKKWFANDQALVIVVKYLGKVDKPEPAPAEVTSDC
jgi:hypothetical protein